MQVQKPRENNTSIKDAQLKNDLAMQGGQQQSDIWKNTNRIAYANALNKILTTSCQKHQRTKENNERGTK